MRKAFTLVELLVVIGILSILVGVLVTMTGGATEKAEKSKGMAIVESTRDALLRVHEDKGRWPKKILEYSRSGDGLLDEVAGAQLADYMDLTTSVETNEDGDSVKRLSGYCRAGIIDPWAEDAIKKHRGSDNAKTIRVQSGGTIEDHILHFAVKADDEEYVTANVNGTVVKVNAPVCVWGAGKDGKFQPYNRRDKSDDLYSWTRKMEVR